MHPNPKLLSSLALLGLAVGGCKPRFSSDVAFKPYHDPFDTGAAPGFSEVPAPEVQSLLKIVERAKPHPRTDTGAAYTHVAFLPYGTITLRGKDTLTCLCTNRKISCDSLHEFQIDSADVAPYRALMRRIDSLDRESRGLPKRTPPPVSTPDVPIN